ncbi:YfjI family protein [Pseudomonas sp. JUb52]|uniref:YfjI family protein n=1 Tax=Pseudomonas sp. JUb52 TaxID=2485127 RepID=UPI0010D5D9CA|nr:YfjI family protein [Pseudomonas sp. JUb52]TCQ90887.1 uncharacterized protein DUF3987 [Pseudomonas sp. JUb52]
MFDQSHDQFWMRNFKLGNEPSLAALPLISDAVNEAVVNIQAPRAIILNAVLTAISTALQGLVDVQKPNGQVTPCSLMLLAIANSGERKSTVENAFLQPFRDFQFEQEPKHDEEICDWKAKNDAWSVRRHSIVKEIKKKSSKGLQTKAEEAALLSIERERPAKPKRFKILYEDVTPEALFHGMHKDLPTAGLISSEGGGILEGRAFNDFSKQNAIWSGDSITIDRKTVDSFQLNDARLTVSLMVQESAFSAHMKQRGEQARGSGLWARFLICHPHSTQGTRYVGAGTNSWIKKETFNLRLGSLLEENLRVYKAGDRKRSLVAFTPEAVQQWIQTSNKIEAQICAGGRFHGLGDHASKLADVIARLAVLLHRFEGFEGDVSVTTLNTAEEIAGFYSEEFIRLFSQDHKDLVDEEVMLNWLVRTQASGQRFIKRNLIRQYGPNRFRHKDALDSVLIRLASKGKIAAATFAGDKSLYVDTCPWMPFLTPNPSQVQVTNFYHDNGNQAAGHPALHFTQCLPGYTI